MGNTVAAEKPPGTDDRAKPAFEVGDDEAAQLVIREREVAENRNGNQILPGRSVGGRDRVQDAKIVNSAAAGAGQQQNRFGGRRSIRGVVKTTDAAGARQRNFAEQFGRRGTVGGDHDRTWGDFFVFAESQSVAEQGIHVGVETYGAVWKFGRKLGGNGTHALGRNADFGFGHGAEDKFEHAAGGVQVAIKHDATKERFEKMLDHHR